MEPSTSSTDSTPGILGLDNVRLELPIAGIGSRSLAALIDHFLLFLLQLVWVAGALVLLPQLGLPDGWTFATLTVGYFLLQWSYFAAFEIALAGRTPGKLAVGLRVVSRGGGRSSATAILVRNFLRTLDLLVGIPMMAVDRRSRRLGDLVAGTLVVHHRDAGDASIQLSRHPVSWGAREVSVVEAFLSRARYLDGASAGEMADRLLRWIRASEPGFWAEIEPHLAVTGDPVATLREALGAG